MENLFTNFGIKKEKKINLFFNLFLNKIKSEFSLKKCIICFDTKFTFYFH